MKVKIEKPKNKDTIIIDFKENGVIKNVFEEILKVLVKFIDKDSKLAARYEEDDVLVLDGKYLDLLRSEEEDELDKLLGGANESQKDK